ncbi:WD40 repeat domain-containing protein [Vulcanococcus limneticus]|uniref:WD40 repeat domain-containing protein n=1 Tax=Vulcanococcus limneticus TaxID=2170428 RepID=UPI00398BF112
MTLVPDLDTLLRLVLPKLLFMTVLSAVVGGVVGAVVAGIVSLLRRSRPGAVGPAVWGSFLGVLLVGLLPIEANPASLIGGPYAGLWFLSMALLFVPVGAVGGALLGMLAIGHPRARLRGPRALAALTLGAYALSAVVLTLTLSPPAITIRTPQPGGPFPLLAEVSGLESIPSHLALSGDGRQLAVLSVRYGRQQVDILDLTSRQQHRIRNLHGKPEGQQTLREILSTLAFTVDGKELVTAALQQVQVRSLPAGRPWLRLDGGSVAYPMAAGRLVTLTPNDASPAPRNLQVWDLASGRRLQAMPADLNTVERAMLPVAVSPDRRLLALPLRVDDDRIEVWDIPQARRITTLELGRRAGLLALAFSPDGGQLAVALGQGPPIAIWDLATARRIRSLDRPQSVQQLHWTTEGLLASSDDGFRVLSPQDGRVLHTLPPGAAAPSVPARPVLSLGPSALSGDRSTFAVPIPGQGIAVWRVGRPVTAD